MEPARHETLRSGAAAIPAGWLLAALVAVGAGVRWLAATGHHTPTFFQDEYLYSALAHGLATTQSVTVRGEAAIFPALLQPLLSAPAWLVDDPAVALRLTQGLHAVAMSLSAVPIYLLARHLQLDRRLAFAIAAFALLHPGLVYASFWLAEPIALPLALTAFYVGVRVLERPTLAGQLAFLSLAGLASFARIQYVLLPVAFLAAALVVERGRVRRVVRRFWPTLLVPAVPLLAVAVLDPSRVFGTYWYFPGWYAPGPLVEWSATSLLVLAYSSGWVVVPGALAAVGLALFRPRSVAERAFSAFLVSAAGVLLLEVAAIASIGTSRVEERYLLMLPPLIAVAFGLWFARGGQRRLVVALALGLLLVSARVPLAEYTAAAGAAGSPTLRAVVALETGIGEANASLVFALVAAAFSLLAALAALRRQFRPAAFGAALLGVAALSLAAHVQDWRGADRTRAALLPADARWVDRFDLGSVSLLHTPDALPPAALSQLFWNRSIDRLLLLDDAAPIDSFGTRRTRVAHDGTLLAEGRPVARPLLVQGGATRIDFLGGRLLGSAAEFDLWEPGGVARVSTRVSGLYSTGWLSSTGEITVWPDASGKASGVLTITLSLPRGAQSNEVAFTGASLARSASVAPGEERTITIPIDADGPSTVRFTAPSIRYDEQLRPVSMRGTIAFRRSEG